MILVDSNVILDVLTNDKHWSDWSSARLLTLGETESLLINDIIYAEISVRLAGVEAVDHVVRELNLTWAATPRNALFLAGKAWDIYRKRGGERTGVLPDFLIGAHAAVDGHRLLTRDVRRFRTYFPTIELITP